MSKKEEKNLPANSFSLLDESVFGQGGDIVFMDENSPIVETPKPDEGLENHDEKGKPIEAEVKETVKIEKDPKEIIISKAEEKPEEKEKEEISQIAVVASWLGEKGIVDYNPEDFEDSEEGLAKIVTNTITKGIDSYKKSKPEDVQIFLDYVDAGGDPKKFHEIYYNQTSWADFKIEDEDDAKSVLETYLKEQGEEDSDIKQTLDVYETAGILEKKAIQALTKIQKAEVTYKEQLIEQQKKFDAEQKVKQKDEYEAFKKDLYSKEEIQGFKLTPAVKDKLWNYITVADRKTGLTGLQKHNQENSNSQFLYAYLAMNDWDINKLSAKITTKIHSELADKLRNSTTDSRSKIKSGQTDSFKDQSTSGFSMFKKAVESGQI